MWPVNRPLALAKRLHAVTETTALAIPEIPVFLRSSDRLLVDSSSSSSSPPRPWGAFVNRNPSLPPVSSIPKMCTRRVRGPAKRAERKVEGKKEIDAFLCWPTDSQTIYKRYRWQRTRERITAGHSRPTRHSGEDNPTPRRPTPPPL